MRALTLLLAGCSDYEFQNTEKNPPGASDTGDCSAFAPAEPAAPGSDETCLNEPATGVFDPVIEWQWLDNALTPGYEMVMMTPVVGHLTDDDGDGIVGGEGDAPDIAFTSYNAGNYGSPGPLNLISGDGSGMHWSLPSAGGYAFAGSGGVVVGDLEGDGRPDLCAAGATVAVICVEGDGTFKWAAGSEVLFYGYPALADLDGDGRSEVIFGRTILDAAGNVVGAGAYGLASPGLSFAADLDGDGSPEIVAGNSVYERDGSLVWTDGLGDGAPAVADFVGDAAPEIVRTAGGTVILSRADGSTVWQASVPGGGGGPPTVADFDGDGEVEVGVAALAYYTVFDTDGSVLWSNPTEDDSSSVTGAAVFDFEGDGAAEVVYADEHTLYVYDGATGAVLMQDGGHASGTLYEYPIIADVDGDGSTEIIVGSNDMWWEGWGGITVLGSASGSWAPAREVWNQHAYSITNVESDGSIPASPAENWDTWNNFRAGGTEAGPGHWLADLRPLEPELCTARCGEGVVEVYLPVENRGLLDAGPFQAALSASEGAADAVLAQPTPGLAAGAAGVLGPLEVTKGQWGEALWVVLDGGEQVEECDEENNTWRLGAWPCRE